MYEEVKSYTPESEEKVLEYWRDNDTFAASLKKRKDAPEYTIYDGPPFATGLPHFGHFIPSTIKDIIPRYKTMKGFHVDRRFGWDCHGLPVENLIEKELGINSKHEIEALGVDKFNEKCQESVLKYTKEWQQIITRLGRWVDFDNDYKTMDAPYMESIWAVAKALWDNGLIYEGKYILPYCPRCATVLSTHELALGYKEKQDPAVTVRFLIKNGHGFDDKTIANGKTYFLAWTTTPWTLPSNEGLCMGPEIDYVKLLDKASGDYYIMAKARVSSYYKTEGEREIIYEKKGKDFLGIEYEPLFPYFAHLSEAGAFRVFNADYVSTEDGTGIVHIAPSFGEDDAEVFKVADAKNGTAIPRVEPMDAECRFTSEVIDYAGRFVKDADGDIMKALKAQGKLIKRDTVVHQYPHCWRCSSPLIYRAISSWFVKVSDHHEALLKANSQIKWQPAHIKEGRFGKWLAGARDWAVSRNRYWGNPIPIWKCSDKNCASTLCIGSREELQKLSGIYPQDLHKQFVDKIEFPCPKCGAKMKRISEVFDCWFESGSMPYAQLHYPFENKAFLESHFPADFISEGLDQTRGWFYTLTVIASHLFDKPAFSNCIVSGLVLASDGRKMSKSLKNYTDPAEALQKFGADAIRLFLVHSAASKADDVRYSDEGVRGVIKDILLPLWSSYSFFVTYANIDKAVPTGEYFKTHKAQNMLDAWLLSLTQKLVQDVSCALDDYDLSGAVDPIVGFIELMNNWYIRRSRRRFWKSENDSDKTEAYEALYTALKTFCLVACPVIPFITETIYLNLKKAGDEPSVHLNDYPEYLEALRDKDIERKMEVVQHAVSLGHSLRNTYNIKNRQPLASVSLVTRDEEERRILLSMEEVIREELNVKRVIFHDKESELVEYRAKANFKVLGKELGASVKEAATKIAKLSNEEVQSVIEGSSLFIDIKDLTNTGGTNRTIEVNRDKIIVERIEKEDLKVLNEGTLTVALDLHVTDSLRREGFVKDLVRGVQNARKEGGLCVTDRIKLEVSAQGELLVALDEFTPFIKGETLATTISILNAPSDDMTKIEVADQAWFIRVSKA